MKKIGFWRSDYEPNLPSILHFVDPAWGDSEKLVVLEYLQCGKECEAYKGWSDCRVCGKPNGSTELTDGEYVWPSGYHHYVAHHDVRPPSEFIEHIWSRWADDLADKTSELWRRCLSHSTAQPDLSTKEGREICRERLKAKYDDD
ncbi:MAG TPA: hypothetical protein VI423_10900 [Paenisporosarcina sp.]|nr:hypothetical protein [Paenisporosarcina sp.]